MLYGKCVEKGTSSSICDNRYLIKCNEELYSLIPRVSFSTRRDLLLSTIEVII